MLLTPTTKQTALKWRKLHFHFDGCSYAKEGRAGNIAHFYYSNKCCTGKPDNKNITFLNQNQNKKDKMLHHKNLDVMKTVDEKRESLETKKTPKQAGKLSPQAVRSMIITWRNGSHAF